MPNPPKRLALVSPSEELSGNGPPDFERWARTATPGSTPHLGLVNLCLTLAREAVRVAIPPSGRKHLAGALLALGEWLDLPAQQRLQARTQKRLRDKRAETFSAVGLVEQLTAEALDRVQAVSSPAETQLGEHARLTMQRYCRLSAHHATAAVCHALDTASDPEAALHVPGDVAGALAYQAAGLGSARHRAFQQAAIDQATWELGRDPKADPQGTGALSLLVFHEYLGARWRAHADLQRERIWSFIAWVLSCQTDAL